MQPVEINPNGNFLQGNSIWKSVLHYLTVYLAINYFSQILFKKPSRTLTSELKDINFNQDTFMLDSKPQSVNEFLNSAVQGTQVFPTNDERGMLLGPHECVFDDERILDLHFYFSDNETIREQDLNIEAVCYEKFVSSLNS